MEQTNIIKWDEHAQTAREPQAYTCILCMHLKISVHWATNTGSFNNIGKNQLSFVISKSFALSYFATLTKQGNKLMLM